MISFRRTPIALVRRALARHLPQTLCETVALSAPVRATALRVLYSRDAAFDYVVTDGEWTRLDRLTAGSPLGVTTAADPEAVAAVIAGDIASWHRRLAYPLASDPRVGSTTEMQRAESEDRITEAMTFLSRLSRGVIACAPSTIDLADQLWNRTDDDMVDSAAEQKADTLGRPVEVAA